MASNFPLTIGFSGPDFFVFLLEASFCSGVFALAYRMLFSRLTAEILNRSYLLLALVLSLLLPLLAFPTQQELTLSVGESFRGSSRLAFSFQQLLIRVTLPPTLPGAGTESRYLLAGWVIGGIYLIGFGYKLWCLGKQLWWIYQLLSKYKKTKSGAYWLVDVPGQSLPAFSFSRFIFLAPTYYQLSQWERQRVLTHEQGHVRQWHTLDLLFYELAGTLLWFNPVLGYLRKQLENVHEYLADQEVIRTHAGVKSYGELLIKLSSQSLATPLLHSFASSQIYSRILMLTRAPASTGQKGRFLLLLPLAAGSWFITACVDLPISPPLQPAGAQGALSGKESMKIGRITWIGNRVFSTEMLNRRLGLKAGDRVDSLALQQRLQLQPDGSDVAALYMDQGYMYFQVATEKVPLPDGSVALQLRITEGKPVRIGKITITGNRKVPASQVRRMIPFQAGEWFNRSRILEAQQNLAQAGYFDPNQVGVEIIPRLQPGERVDIADISFSLVEKE